MHLRAPVWRCQIQYKIQSLFKDQTEPAQERVFSSHLVLLGELEVVVGFESLQVISQIQYRDGRMIGHACG